MHSRLPGISGATSRTTDALAIERHTASIRLSPGRAGVFTPPSSKYRTVPSGATARMLIATPGDTLAASVRSA